LSVLTLGEIRAGVERIRPSDPIQASALARWLDGSETAYDDRILPITATIALRAVDPPFVVDCLIAATALENDLRLVTRNTQDVSRTGVQLLNPFETFSR